MENENYISEVDILDESKESFLTYASEVLTDRAIPAAEDGLLSAQRKLLWTMEDYLKMSNSGKTKKCNAIVGSTLATSYFHGDISCYGVLCKMSQPFLMRYPLIEGQGSLGTQENNDMVASSRYTEAKPSEFADVMMNDFKKNVVPVKETYNGEFMEPVVLPSIFPNAICNGRQAIGISMAHNSLPHNLTEVCNAIIAYIEKGSLTVDEIMEYIKGPDFPLNNTIINAKDIRAAFETGKSSVSLKVRGNYIIRGQEIIFISIPYRTYRNKIKEQINKNIDEIEKYIDDFDDESSLGNNKIIFRVKQGINPESAVQKLFALTDLQTTVSYNMNYIVNGTPKLCSMADLIKAYISHQEEVLIKATEFDKDKAEKRKHILEGLIIAVTNIDKAIELIRNSINATEARDKLIDYFKITEEQAKAILDMKLAKLTKLDKDELLNELKDKVAIIDECNKILTEQDYRNAKLIEKVTWLRDKYGDARRTALTNIEIPKTKEDKEVAEVVPEDVVVVTTQNGMVKRVPLASFKVQKRNTKGIKNDEMILDMVKTNTVDTMMFFTDKGKMYRCVVDKIPAGTNTTKGTYIGDIAKLEPNEKIVAVSSLHRTSTPKYVIFFTKNGIIKKSFLEEYTKNAKNGGVQAIKLAEDDSIIKIIFMDNEDIVAITKLGMGIRFASTEVNAIGRVAVGVKAIKLAEGDELIAALPIHKDTDTLALFAQSGIGKKIPLSDLPRQGRGGKGVIVYKDEIVAGAAMVSDEDNILINGSNTSLVISAKEIPELTRTSGGNIMIKDNRIKSITKI